MFERQDYKADAKIARAEAAKIIDGLKAPKESLPEGTQFKVKKELAYDGYYGPCGISRYKRTAVLNMRYPGLGSAPCTFRLRETSPDMDYAKFGGIDRMKQYLSETENPAQDMLTNYLSNISSIIKDKVWNGMSMRKANKKVKAVQSFINEHCSNSEKCSNSEENKQILEDLKKYVSENVITDRVERFKARARYIVFGEQ